jgi:DNA-binding response OmpR family regulator
MANKKILVVEDDSDTRKGYQIRLKANLYDAYFATDTVTALRLAREHQPDLIILDLGLPGGDGFVVMERLKLNSQLALIPIIVVSARAGLAIKERAEEAGAKAFLQKPVDNAELLAVIRQTLGGPTEPKELASLAEPNRRKFLL